MRRGELNRQAGRAPTAHARFPFRFPFPLAAPAAIPRLVQLAYLDD